MLSNARHAASICWAAAYESKTGFIAVNSCFASRKSRTRGATFPLVRGRRKPERTRGGSEREEGGG
eukprot:7341625-Pyramimonas_sp.AAC.1